MLFGTIIQYIRIFLGIGVMIMRTDQLFHIEKCESEYCFYSDLTPGMVGIIIILLSFIIQQTCIGLFISIKIRLEASPDYCIQTTEMMKYQHFKFAHKTEIWFFILQMIISINYGIEGRIIARSFETLNYITNTNSQYSQEIVQNYLLITAIFLIGLEVIKMTFDAYATTKGMIGFFKSESVDQANYLQHCLVKVQVDSMMNVEEVLSSYCPQTGILLKGKLWNIKQICELINATLETALVITMSILQVELRKLYGQIGFGNIYLTSDILFLFGIIKSFVKILKHFHSALMSRPPQLKVTDLNEALLLRRYQKLGRSLQLAQKIPLKGQKAYANLQSNTLKKSGFDQKLGIATNTKSDRSIVIKKGSLVQLMDEAIDYIPESIQVPMDPISNKSMKNINDKYQ